MKSICLIVIVSVTSLIVFCSQSFAENDSVVYFTKGSVNHIVNHFSSVSPPKTPSETELNNALTRILSDDFLVEFGEDAQAIAMRGYANDEMTFFSDAAIKLSGLNAQIVESRLNFIRQWGGRGIHVSGLNLMDQSGQQPSNQISSETIDKNFSRDSRLGIFLASNGSYAELDQTNYQAGYESKGYTVDLGADYRFTDHILAGAYVSYLDNEIKYETTPSTADTSGVSYGVYATYFMDKFYFDVTYSRTNLDNDFTRAIVYPGVDELAKTDGISSQHYNMSAGAGYNLSYNDWKFGLETSINYINAQMDPYTETAAGSTDYFLQKMDDQSNIKSTQYILGGNARYNIKTKNGVISPYIRIYGHYEIDHNKRGHRTYFINDPSNTIFSIFIDDRDTLYGRTNLGLTSVLNCGLSLYLDASTLVGMDNTKAYSFTAGGRWAFSY